MKNLDDSLSIAKLITKSFQQELPESENAILEDWLSDPGNRRLYDSLRYRNLSEKQQQIRFLHPGKSWSKLEKQIIFRTKLRIFHYAKYAAAILIPAILISVLYISYKIALKDPIVFCEQDIPTPGSPRALLILQNGEQIELSVNQNLYFQNDSTLTLNNQDNTLKIEHTASGSLTNDSYQTLSIPIGGEYKLILSDGTKIWLNSDTRLRFPMNFSDGKRLVYLEGEAYFEVSHQAEHPFIVATQGVEIQVLGTKFNVKAYTEESVIYTTLAEGSVRTTDRQTAASLLLIPNQQCLYSKATGQMKRQKVDARIFTGWTEGKFVFENEPLEEIMKQLNRWYDTQVVYQSPEIKNYHFTGHVDRFDQISTILQMIEKTYDITFNIQDKMIVVNKK